MYDSTSISVSSYSVSEGIGVVISSELSKASLRAGKVLNIALKKAFEATVTGTLLALG